MKYADARPLIQSGDLIAESHAEWRTLYDWKVQAVRFFTQSEYCHVALAWPIGGRLFALESVMPKVRMVPLSSMAKKGFYWVPLGAPMSDAELEFALSQIGVGTYSQWLAIVAQVRGIDINDNAFWECAKYVIRCRALSGIALGQSAVPSNVVRCALDLPTTALHFVSDAS